MTPLPPGGPADRDLPDWAFDLVLWCLFGFVLFNVFVTLAEEGHLSL